MNVFGLRRNLLIALPISLLALSSAATATTISGTANIGGTATVTATSVIFNPNFTALAGGLNTGSFAGLTTGTIQPTTLSGTGAVNIVNFMTFNVGGVLTPVFFDLKNISPGSDVPGSSAAACVTNIGICAPPGSAFSLSNVPGGGVTAALALQGIGYTGTSASGSSPTIESFTAQFVIPGLTVSQLLAQLGAGTCTVCSGASYSAQITAVAPSGVPEPSAASLLFAGVALIAGSRVIRRYRQQA